MANNRTRIKFIFVTSFVTCSCLMKSCLSFQLTVVSLKSFQKGVATSELDAKPKRQAPADLPTSDSTKIPANLRRKIQAKRPTLGHVVGSGGIRQAQNSRNKGGSSGPILHAQGKNRKEGLNNPSLLKIASGTARGRRLDSPQVYLRPMMGKVKEAVFSTFAAFGLYESACRHLDIFSGSGSVGLESLSRGADHCTFVDLSSDCCACVERNLIQTGLMNMNEASCKSQSEKALILCADALTALNAPHSVGIPVGSRYQIVTLCPPYEEVVYGDLLEAVVGSVLVTDDTVILVEYPVELGCLPHVLAVKDNIAVGVRNRRYGRTVIAMYVVNPTGKLEETASSRPEEFVHT